MRRNIFVASQLLDIIIDNDERGTGMPRRQIQELFRGSGAGSQMSETNCEEVVDYHLHLLQTAGFVECHRDLRVNLPGDEFRMTWAGHEHVKQ